jgi:hypothetical protein
MSFDMKAWCLAHRDELNAKQKLRRQDPAYRRREFASKLSRLYGLSFETWETMLIAQNGCCASCNDPMIGPKDPCVDHDHKTGKVRALLCGACNRALGHARENVHRLQKSVRYLLSQS